MNVADLQTRTLEGLNEDPDAPVFYTAIDALAALNLMQRIYAFLTLCLEVAKPVALTPGLQWYTRRQFFSDMILILRCGIQTSGSTGGDSTTGTPEFGAVGFNDQQSVLAASLTPKLAPATFDEMAALDSSWVGKAGTPAQYNAAGFNLLVFDKAPDAAYTVYVTYARMPTALTKADDVPEIPEPDHQSLIDGAVGFLRIREGGQELANDAPGLQAFFGAVSRRADQIRTRSLAQRYDRQPPEIGKFDLSRLLKKRADLNRKDTAWTSPQ